MFTSWTIYIISCNQLKKKQSMEKKDHKEIAEYEQQHVDREKRAEARQDSYAAKAQKKSQCPSIFIYYEKWLWGWLLRKCAKNAAPN